MRIGWEPASGVAPGREQTVGGCSKASPTGPSLSPLGALALRVLYGPHGPAKRRGSPPPASGTAQIQVSTCYPPVGRRVLTVAEVPEGFPLVGKEVRIILRHGIGIRGGVTLPGTSQGPRERWVNQWPSSIELQPVSTNEGGPRDGLEAEKKAAKGLHFG